MKTKLIAYWTCTVLLALVLLSGGAAQLIQRPENVEGMAHLGYPAYLLTILGFWKLLGGVVLLVPRLPLLKEWAYAGAFFDLSGAAASHAFAHDPTARVLIPAAFAVLTLASWALRPDARRVDRGRAHALVREPARV